MKAQVINTAFLHDGTYYYQNSIIDVPSELITKYPNNLLPIINSENEVKEKDSVIQNPIQMIQNNSDANNIIIKQKVSRKNKRAR